MKDSPIRKLGFDLITLIDMEDAEATMRTLWHGSPEAETDMKISDYGAALFTVMRPRPGALGALREMHIAGCTTMFFTDITDTKTGDRAEKWLQEWSDQFDIGIHQIDPLKLQSPVQLDCQGYILAEGHSYEIPKGRPRVTTHKRGGSFDMKVVEKLR